jgi:hypothetical protein
VKAVRVALAALGVAAMGYALWAALRSPDIIPTRNGSFLLAVLVLHDGVLLPVFLVAGALVHRAVPPGMRAIVQAALIASAAVTLVAAPFLLGYGRTADNPSALPRDYPHGLLTVLAAIWVAAAAAMTVHVYNGRRRHASGSRPTGEDR